MRMSVALVIAPERHPECAPDVKRGHTGGNDAYPIHPRGVSVGRTENSVFTEISRGEGETGDREGCTRQRDAGDGSVFLQPTHVPHVLLAMASMDDAAGTEEEEGLEERMRHQMPDARGEGSDANAKEHVAQLGDG